MLRSCQPTPQAERTTEIKLDSVPDDFDREPIAAIIGFRCRDHHARILDVRRHFVNLTVPNVGLIGGGQTVNTIASSAWCEIDLRYVEPAQRDELVAAIQSIVETPSVEGTSAMLNILGEFLPLMQSPASLQLLDVYTRAAARFGVDVTADFSGGCADSVYSAAVATRQTNTSRCQPC